MKEYNFKGTRQWYEHLETLPNVSQEIGEFDLRGGTWYKVKGKPLLTNKINLYEYTKLDEVFSDKCTCTHSKCYVSLILQTWDQ